MNKLIFLFIFFSFCFFSVFSKTTHLITITPNFDTHYEKDYEMDFMRVTLFTKNRLDSLILLKYNSCLELKKTLSSYDGAFIYINDQIKFTEVKIEHPRYSTFFTKLNIQNISKDSIDVFNKRHHILIYNTPISLEKECNTKQDFDYLFWTNNNPYGGYYFRNEIGVLLQDTLTDTLFKEFTNRSNLELIELDAQKKILRFKMGGEEIKNTKNQVIKELLLDRLIVKDAGFVVDTVSFSFVSSFIKIASIPTQEINKMKLIPISGLKNMSQEMSYIKENNLKYGCGLYRYKEGHGSNLIHIQNSIKKEKIFNKCTEKEKILELELEYLFLKTINLSSSGGKHSSRKKELNLKKMARIYEKKKKLKPAYFSKIGRLDLILIN